LLSQHVVQVEVVRALLGVWLFGALLRRELLSVCASIFKFVDKHQEGRHRWWASARVEFQAMCDLIPYTNVDFTLPAAPVLFATDAMGHSDAAAGDNGGFGIVGSDCTRKEIIDIYASSFQPGKCVTKLDGTLATKWTTRTSLTPTIPFTRLPAAVFGKHWTVLDFGRWRFADHITAGESRAHWKCIQALAGCSRAHNHRFVLLEDNFCVSASMSKGRATAPLLNYYCRRRAATSLAANFYTSSPWVQTDVMPADAASRLQGDPCTEAPRHGLARVTARPPLH